MYSPSDTYADARHLGAVDRPFVIPRIRLPETTSRGTLSPLYIPRVGPSPPLNAAYASPIYQSPSPYLHRDQMDIRSDQMYLNRGAETMLDDGVGHVGAELPPPPPSDGAASVRLVRTLPPQAYLAPGELLPSPFDDTQKKALNDNDALSFQLILFSIIRYPSLILIFISMGTLWGRGQHLQKGTPESGAAISAFSTGMAVVILTMCFLFDHRNNYTRAKWLALARHCVCLVSLVGGVTTLVFSAAAVQPISNLGKSGTDVDGCEGCYSVHERTTYNAVLVGTSCLVTLLAMFALCLGCLGVFQMPGRLRSEREKLKRAQHDNPGFLH